MNEYGRALKIIESHINFYNKTVGSELNSAIFVGPDEICHDFEFEGFYDDKTNTGTCCQFIYFVVKKAHEMGQEIFVKSDGIRPIEHYLKFPEYVKRFEKLDESCGCVPGTAYKKIMESVENDLKKYGKYTALSYCFNTHSNYWLPVLASIIASFAKAYEH